MTAIVATEADCARDSLAEIKQLLEKDAPVLRRNMAMTRSLRGSYPETHVTTSIYGEAGQSSIYSASDEHQKASRAGVCIS